MASVHDVTTSAVLVFCLAASPFSVPVFASDEPGGLTRGLSEPRSTVGAPTRVSSSGVSTPASPSPFAVSGDMLSERLHLGAKRAAYNANSREAYDRRWGHGRGGHHGGHDGAQAALILGSIAAIAGGAVLVYANRPACGATPEPGGCGYGTKVIGGAVLAGGVAGLVIGTAAWH